MRRVTQVHVRPIEKINTFYKLTVSKDGAEEDFYVTGEHPFWIADKAEWRSVDELSVGDALADFGGHRLRVSAKAPVSEKQQTYNISVEGNATYFAGRSEVLVHNNNCGSLTAAVPPYLADLVKTIAPDMVWNQVSTPEFLNRAIAAGDAAAANPAGLVPMA